MIPPQQIVSTGCTREINARASITESSDIDSADIDSAGISSTDIHSTDIHSTGIESTPISPTEISNKRPEAKGQSKNPFDYHISIGWFGGLQIHYKHETL